MKTQMPKIDLEKIATLISPVDFELLKGIVATKGKNKGCLRASKPKVKMHIVRVEHIETQYGAYDKKHVEPDEKQGKTAYIWRMVAFQVSPKSQHHCMPVTADFDVPGSWGTDKRKRLAELDIIVDVVTGTVDTAHHHGTRRWAQVYGLVGTPVVQVDGSIVYR